MNALKNAMWMLFYALFPVVLISAEIMSTHGKSMKRSVKLYTASFFLNRHNAKLLQKQYRKKSYLIGFMNFLCTDVPSNQRILMR